MPEQQGPEQQGPEQQGPEQHGPEQRGTGTQWVAGSGGASLRNAFRNLADAIPQLAWIATPDGDIHWYNRRWYEYTGRSFAEMRGQGWRELHHPDHLERVVARFRAALENGEEWEDTFPLRRHDGTYRWFLSRALPLRDAGGRIIQWSGTNTDVTETRGAEERLRRSEERFRTLMDASSAIIWTTPGSGEFEAPQPRWMQFTGQSWEEHRGWGWLEAIHPEDRGRTAEVWGHAKETHSLYAMEHRVRRWDGAWRHMEVRAAPVLAQDGSLREWVGSHTDITDRKRAEEELEQARDAAESANRAKSQFIANMSHELRTPLSAVIGYSEMLAEEVEDVGEAHLLADLRKIESNARHLLGLINDVLDLSKIEAGRMTVSVGSFDVAALLAEAAGAVQPLVARRGNTLSLRLEEPLGAMESDQTKIRQCLLNLLGNASKFTEEGRITLAARREAGEGRDWLVFQVIDTGIGMSAEQLSRLFQRFTQADESTTRQFGGTGLGLSITRAFCRELGGEVSAESTAGQGSVFTMRLPARFEAAAKGEGEAMAAEAAPVEQEGRVVLVVDDDPAARELMTRFLEREGFQVRCASDGRSGLALARALKPRAVLLDVEMPQMDGWSVLHAIRGDPLLSGVPVVMASVVNEKRLGHALGATDYLTKPIAWERLRRIMERFRPPAAEGEVLIVDDDAEARGRLRTMLQRDGWRVAEAGDGRAGLELVTRSLPSLVLLDLMMPVMDGFGFLEGLRQRPEGAEVPVIVLTAKDVTPEERAWLDRRAERLILKGSVSLNELAHEVRDLVPAPEENSRERPPPAAGRPA